ncbi:Uma2 family endonuclease [Microlunatus parietis]|uniref:Uma2 family endonuclease n=1 Tax=Microlunatus parietis TaxID=682979 RepID=A0A7Y9LC40_9ACTN|nr:Uma2 family endonuclease [Microlunatus parietis]NYE74459.1 Uma2 family endonuclease [Microlunatus parietis]
MTAHAQATWPRPGEPFTKAHLELLPDDGRRSELLDGVLIVSPTPTWLHQRALLNLMMLLHRDCPPELEVLPGPLNIDISEDSVLRPDLLVVRRDRLGEVHLAGMPDLVVEVLSPETHRFDLDLKRGRYEDAGCPNYWVVDPDAPSIVMWDMVDGRYREAGRAEGDTELCPTSPYHVVANPARLVD